MVEVEKTMISGDAAGVRHSYKDVLLNAGAHAAVSSTGISGTKIGGAPDGCMKRARLTL